MEFFVKVYNLYKNSVLLSKHIVKKNMDLFGFGSFMSGIASLFGVQSASQTAAEDRAFTREENQKNRDFTEKMWNAQNAYNTPFQQIRRITAAGLNPALAYGSVSDGMASTAPTPSTSSNSNPSQVPAAFANLANQFLQLDVLKSQAEKNRADADAAEADAAKTRRSNRLFDATFSDQVERAMLENKNLSSSVALAAANLRRLSLSNQYDEQSMQWRISLLKGQLEKLNADTEYQKEAMRWLGYDAETRRIGANASKLSAQAAMYVAPAMAYNLMTSGYYNTAMGDFQNSEANYALAIGKAFEAQANGQLTLEKCEQIFVETFNLTAYGDKNPGSGGNPLSLVRGAAAEIYNVVTGKRAFAYPAYPRARVQSPFHPAAQKQGRKRRVAKTPALLRPPKYSWQK